MFDIFKTFQRGAVQPLVPQTNVRTNQGEIILLIVEN